jgi:hypothetical protein
MDRFARFMHGLTPRQVQDIGTGHESLAFSSRQCGEEAMGEDVREIDVHETPYPVAQH